MEKMVIDNWRGMGKLECDVVKSIDDITKHGIVYVQDLKGFVSVEDVTGYATMTGKEKLTLYRCKNCKPISREADVYCYVVE